MAVEDELFEEMVRVFQRLRQMVERFRSRSGVSRGQQERMLREAMRDWLREDPQANALRQRMEDREFERRVAAEVDRVLEDRFGPQNDPNDRNRNGLDDAQDRREQDEQVRDDKDRDGDGVDDAVEQRDEAQKDLDRDNDRDGDGVDDAVQRREQDREEQDREENRRREEEQQVEENPDHVRLDLVPVAAGAAAAAEAEELTEERQDEQDRSQETDELEVDEQPQGARDQVDGQQQEGPEDQRDPEVVKTDADGQLDSPAVIGAEEERADALADERDPEVVQTEADGQLDSPAVSGADARDELEDQQPEQEQVDGAEQQALPTAGDRRAEAEALQAGEQNQEQQPGQHRPEVVEARMAAEQGQPGQQQDQPGQQQDQPGQEGQAATGQDAVSDEVQKLRDLGYGGQRPPSAAARRPDKAPGATPHGGVTPAEQHRRTTQGTGREVDNSSGRERT
jgi:hypothetical protein